MSENASKFKTHMNVCLELQSIVFFFLSNDKHRLEQKHHSRFVVLHQKSLQLKVSQNSELWKIGDDLFIRCCA